MLKNIHSFLAINVPHQEFEQIKHREVMVELRKSKNGTSTTEGHCVVTDRSEVSEGEDCRN